MNDEEILPGYLRVTEVLSPYSGYGSVPKVILDAAQEKGKNIHRYAEGQIKGIGSWDMCDDYQGYYDSFDKWWKPKEMEVICTETRFYCHDHRITGQMDLIMKHEGKVKLIDFKTSCKENKIWPLQGGAYHHLAKKNGYEIEEIIFIHLQKDGKEPKLLHYHSHCFQMFLKCLDLYHIFFKK